MGLNDRSHPPSDTAAALALIRWFQNTARTTYIGGTPAYWRSLSRDANPDPAWAGVYQAMDVVQPWTVGRYGDLAGVERWRTEQFVPDLAATSAHQQLYMPVIFPGFSWHNLDPRSPQNQIPRLKGEFLWQQARNARAAGATLLKIAMFDEVNEGTAMFKAASHRMDAPDRGYWLTLDADGSDLPSDLYLRLAGEITTAFHKNAPLADFAPTLTGIISVAPIQTSGRAQTDPAPTLPVTARLLKLSVQGNGKATATPDLKIFHADIQTAADKVADIQAYRNALPLQEGATYTLKYRAKSSVPRGLGVALKLDQGDFHPLCRVDGISLSTEWQEFTKVFQAKGTEPNHSRLEFDLGGQTGDVWLTDIRLTPGAMALKPGKNLLAPVTDFTGWDISLFGRLNASSEWQPGTGGTVTLTAEGAVSKVVVSQRSSPETCWAALIGHTRLKENTAYTLQFRARAEPARDIWLIGELESFAAPQNGLDFHAAATPEWKDFTATFTTKPGMTGQNLTPEFQVSNRVGIVWFSDVTLTEAHGFPVRGRSCAVSTLSSNRNFVCTFVVQALSVLLHSALKLLEKGRILACVQRLGKGGFL